MTFLSLFSGIGGMDLGLERAGMKCVAQVEIDPYCRKVLAKHWPDVPKFNDVKDFHREDINETPGCIAGGFPCQDISHANPFGRGLAGERSGLWREFYRVIREIRPRFAIVENSPALTTRGLGIILRDLAAIGFNAEWSVLSACAMGAPHTRERLFILAYPQQAEWWPIGSQRCDLGHWMLRVSREREEDSSRFRKRSAKGGGQWYCEPAMGRVANGVPGRMDRLGGLGNAVVPQVAEWIGQRIEAVDAIAREAGGINV